MSEDIGGNRTLHWVRLLSFSVDPMAAPVGWKSPFGVEKEVTGGGLRWGRRRIGGRHRADGGEPGRRLEASGRPRLGRVQIGEVTGSLDRGWSDWSASARTRCLVPLTHSKWYHGGVATNLRLDERAAAALRDASQRTGRSQQELLREAIDRYLGLGAAESARDRAVRSGLVQPPSPFLDAEPRIRLATGLSTLDLLDREDER